QAARAGAGGVRNQRVIASVKTTEEIARTLRVATLADRRLNHTVRNAAPLLLPDAELALPSYALGVWLGDGHPTGARYTSDDPEIALYVEAEGLHVVPGAGRTY